MVSAVLMFVLALVISQDASFIVKLHVPFVSLLALGCGLYEHIHLKLYRLEVTRERSVEVIWLFDYFVNKKWHLQARF